MSYFPFRDVSKWMSTLKNSDYLFIYVSHFVLGHSKKLPKHWLKLCLPLVVLVTLLYLFPFLKYLSKRLFPFLENSAISNQDTWFGIEELLLYCFDDDDYSHDIVNTAIIIVIINIDFNTIMDSENHFNILCLTYLAYFEFAWFPCPGQQ